LSALDTAVEMSIVRLEGEPYGFVQVWYSLTRPAERDKASGEEIAPTRRIVPHSTHRLRRAKDEAAGSASSRNILGVVLCDGPGYALLVEKGQARTYRADWPRSAGAHAAKPSRRRTSRMSTATDAPFGTSASQPAAKAQSVSAVVVCRL